MKNTMSTTLPIDGNDSSSSTYYTLNPSTFSVPSLWSYRQIQKLCKQLGLNASGTREKLVSRLQEWHIEGRHGDKAECGKFGLIGIKLHSPKRKHCSVSPSLLSPLRKTSRKKREDGSVVSPRSILKRKFQTKNGASVKDNFTTNLDTETPSNKTRKLLFSPYNMVRVISPVFRNSPGEIDERL